MGHSGNSVGAGDTLGGYEILEKVGEGGMGVVYLARDTQLQRQVALKLIAPHLTGDEEFRRRFIAEARTAAAIDHPHVVTIYAAGTVEEVLYIAMRHVNGRDLRTVLREDGALSSQAAITMVTEVASALDAAHSTGVVHRDVKPANLLIEGTPGKGKTYLTDFGLIKYAHSQTRLTGTAQWVGTIDYVAPEQIQGDDVGPYTDVYALGCVLYESLTGEVPFEGDDLQKMWGHVHEPFPDVRAKLKGSDSAIAAAIEQATAKDPAKRFHSAGDFAHALVAAPTVTGRTPLRPREAPTRAMQPPRRPPAPPRRDSHSYRAPLVMAVATLLAAGMIAAAIVISSSGDSQGRRANTVIERASTPAANATTTTPPASSPSSPSAETGAGSTISGTADWSGGSAYSAMLGAFSTEANARTWQRRAAGRGLEAGVIYSSEFRSLRPGYWVVFSGAFSSLEEAEARAARAVSLGFPGSYAKLVAP